MTIRVEREEFVDRRGQRRTRRIMHIECDWCGVEFQSPYKKYKLALEESLCYKHAKQKAAKLGGCANLNKHGKEHFRQLGLLHGSKNVVHAIRWMKTVGHKKEVLSRAGRIGGRRTVESGKLADISKHDAHTPSAEAKRWETIKRTGKMKESEPERKFLAALEVHYGVVERHLVVDGFHTDGYVPSLGVYVQFDGEYWHGLDRPYGQLEERVKRKFDLDRRADCHFLKTGKLLVRITDREFKSCAWECIVKKLECHYENLHAAAE